MNMYDKHTYDKLINAVKLLLLRIDDFDRFGGLEFAFNSVTDALEAIDCPYEPDELDYSNTQSPQEDS